MFIISGMAIRPVLLLSLATLVLSSLEVYGPASVKDQFNSTINYTVANFGHIPFGKTLVGPLYVAEPLDACNSDLLQPLPSTQTSFVLIKRGSCNFVKKVENAEKIGAKVAIIMDNVPENTGYLTMKDDGTGYRVKIPSILISIGDGDLLRNSIANNVTLKITFDTAKTDRVNITLWLEANNRMSYHLVRDFAADFQKVKDAVDVKIIHHTTTCYFCRTADCYGDGKYCSLNHELASKAQGRDILAQQLRQRIVFDLYPDKWWSYMDKFDLECDDLLAAEKCSAKLFDKLEIDSAKVQAAVLKEIESQNILSQNKEYLDGGGIVGYPAVSINNLRVPGSLKSIYLLEEICTTLNQPPQGCSSVIDMGNSQSPNIIPSPNYGWTIALIMLISTLVFAFAFCLAKRCLRRRMSVEMSSQVNDMVSRYIEFYSDRTHK